MRRASRPRADAMSSMTLDESAALRERCGTAEFLLNVERTRADAMAPRYNAWATVQEWLFQEQQALSVGLDRRLCVIDQGGAIVQCAASLELLADWMTHETARRKAAAKAAWDADAPQRQAERAAMDSQTRAHTVGGWRTA